MCIPQTDINDSCCATKERTAGLNDRDEQAQEAAYLYAQQRFSQQQIADCFNCSQSHVARLLKIAEDRGWLKREPRFDKKGIPPKRLEEIQRVLEPRTLITSLRKISSPNRVQVRNVRVYPSGLGSFEERLVSFGRAAAGRLVELIEKSAVIGVPFGETLHRAIDGIAWNGFKPKTRAVIEVTPVAGEVSTYVRLGSSSTMLAHRLHGLVNDDTRPPQYSLAAIPFVAPKRSGPGQDDSAVIRRWIEEQPSYHSVLGDDGPVVSRIDCLLTSVGQEGKPLSAASQEITHALGRNPSTLDSLALTDIGGTLIPRPGLSEWQQQELEAINSVMFNLKLSHYESIAAMAADPTKSLSDQVPGVCVVAIGANKANGLLAVLERGLVNELVIDTELATTLKRLLE